MGVAALRRRSAGVHDVLGGGAGAIVTGSLTDRELGRLLLALADRLGSRPGADGTAALLREAGRRLQRPAGPPPEEPGRCAGCGQALRRSGPGRPRRWCGEACRSRWRRATGERPEMRR